MAVTPTAPLPPRPVSGAAATAGVMALIAGGFCALLTLLSIAVTRHVYQLQGVLTLLSASVALLGSGTVALRGGNLWALRAVWAAMLCVCLTGPVGIMEGGVIVIPLILYNFVGLILSLCARAVNRNAGRALNWTSAIALALFAGTIVLDIAGQTVSVAGPFYLMYNDSRDQMALYRCPDGPQKGCAVDGLPNATLFAAGADDKYVVVAQHPSTDRGITQYYYFARVPEERSGWGNNPEKIIGPLTQAQFDAASASHHLPPLSIVLDDLK